MDKLTKSLFLLEFCLRTAMVNIGYFLTQAQQQVPTIEHLELLASIVTSFLLSSGFWLYLAKRGEKKDNRDKLLMGLAHDRIVYLGLKYIERGCISQEEHENLLEYLFLPYAAMGGNGSAKRVMDEVNKLPIKKNIDILNNKGLCGDD